MDVDKSLIYEKSFEEEGDDYCRLTENQKDAIDPSKMAMPYLSLLELLNFFFSFWEHKTYS